MAIKLNAKYLEPFVQSHELDAIAHLVSAAHETLESRSGLGNDFLGWVNLPEDYDKDEFERIKKAAQRIQEKADVLTYRNAVHILEQELLLNFSNHLFIII